MEMTFDGMPVYRYRHFLLTVFVKTCKISLFFLHLLNETIKIFPIKKEWKFMPSHQSSTHFIIRLFLADDIDQEEIVVLAVVGEGPVFVLVPIPMAFGISGPGSDFSGS